MNSKNNERSLLEELKPAGLSWFAKWAAGLVVTYAAIVLTLATVHFDFTDNLMQRMNFEKLGQFGDSFGAMTSLLNALALAALVATVILQNRELRETRQQLTLQATAQQKTAAVADKQLEQNRRLEYLKMRPLIRAEWLFANTATFTIELAIRNVGLGPAIVDAIHAPALTDASKTLYEQQPGETEAIWHESIERCFQSADTESESSPLTIVGVQHIPLRGHSSVLVSGEARTAIVVSCKFSDSAVSGKGYPFLAALQENALPTIHFRAINGQRYSTDDQLDSILSSDS